MTHSHDDSKPVGELPDSQPTAEQPQQESQQASVNEAGKPSPTSALADSNAEQSPATQPPATVGPPPPPPATQPPATPGAPTTFGMPVADPAGPPIAQPVTQPVAEPVAHSVPASSGLQLPAGMNPRNWWTGAVAGAGSYVAVLVLSLLLTLLAVIGLAASGSSDSVPVPDNPIVSDGDLPSPWSVLFQLAAQFPAMGMFGSLGGEINANLGLFGSYGISVGIIALPLLLTVAALAGLVISGRLAEKVWASASMADRIMQSLISGIVFSLFLNVMATAASVRIPFSDEFAISFNAANFTSIVFAGLVGAVASFAGRAKFSVPTVGNKGFAYSLLRDTAVTLAVHAGTILVIVIPVAVIVLGIKGGWGATLSSPLWAPTVGLILLGLGHFAAFGTVAGAGTGSAGLGKETFGYAMTGSLDDFALPAWAGWLLVLLVLVATVAAALYWYLRRGAKNTSSIGTWLPLPLGFLVLGALVLWLTKLQATFSMSQASGGASVGLAWWTPFLLVLWGLAMEAASRHLAPVVVPLLPTALVVRAQKSPSVISADTAGVAGSAVPQPHNTNQVQASAGVPSATGTAAATGAPVVAERQPLTKKAKRNLVISGSAVALVAVLAIGSVITINTVRSSNGPDKVVQAYLEALVSGDAERAMEISDPSVPNASRVLLSNDIYGKATERPDGFSIVKTTVDGDRSQVAVELRQDGEKVTRTFELAKSDPSLLDDHWKMLEVAPGTVRIAVSSEPSAIVVNGVEVSVAGLATESGGYYYELPAFPGTYDLGLPATSKYLTAENATVAVSIQSERSSSSATLEMDTNEAFSKAVTEQVSAMLAACAKQTVLEPENCPISAYEYSDTRNVKWTIDSEPAVETYATSDGTWQLSSSDLGEATVNYERDTSYGSNAPEWKKDSYKDSFYVRGIISIDKDELTIEFSSY